MYLLGDFEVYLKGTGKTLKKRSETIGFGSIVPQGLPFYSGNIIYEREIDVPDCDLKITVSKYRGALVKIFLDGKDAGNIILPPYSLKIEKLPQGCIDLNYFTVIGITLSRLPRLPKDLLRSRTWYKI